MADDDIDELNEEEREIVVSPLFTHITADATIVMDLGRDVEIALTRVSSRPTARQVVDTDSNRRRIVKFEPSNSEVARIRMAPESAMDLAMQIIVRMIQADRVNIAGLQEAITEIGASAKTDSAGTDTDDK